MAAPPRFAELIGALVDGECRFIVVGGVAAVLEGVPISTFDLDIVHDRDPENVAQVLKVLQSLEAVYRDPGRGPRRSDQLGHGQTRLEDLRFQNVRDPYR